MCPIFTNMADVHTKEIGSENMAALKGKGIKRETLVYLL